MEIQGKNCKISYKLVFSHLIIIIDHPVKLRLPPLRTKGEFVAQRRAENKTSVFFASFA